MKYAKSAAVVVGSVMALGASVPAFAADAGAPKMSLNGGLTDALNNKELNSDHVTPLVDAVKEGTAKVKSAEAKELLGGTTGATKKTAPLLGGLALGK